MSRLPACTQSQSLAYPRQIIRHRLRRNQAQSFLPPSNSTREMLLFGFKNRTPRLDFYGLVKKTVLLSHTWSLPLPGPVQLLDQLCSSSQGPRGEMWDQADLWVWPWLWLSVMAPSHSPAALPQPMQLRLGRSVSSLSAPAC